MKTKAAVLWGLHQKWEVEEVELDGPKECRGSGQADRQRALPLRRPPGHR